MAYHATIVSALLFTIFLMTIVANVIPVNASFELFLYLRTLAAGLLGVALRVLIMVHYRFRSADSIPKVSTATSTNMDLSSPKSLQSLDSVGVLEI